MKILILALLMTGSLLSHGQTLDPKNDPNYKSGKLIYESVAENKSYIKSELYANAKKWLADTFVSAKSVIQTEDVTTGQIIGKGKLNLRSSYLSAIALGSQAYKFSVQFDLRDGKYRMRIYDIYMSVNVSGEDYDVSMDESYAKAKPITGKNKIDRMNEATAKRDAIFNELLQSFKSLVENNKNDKF